MKVAFFPLSHEVSGPCNPDLRYVNVMTSKIFTSSKVPVLAASWTISATHKKRERDTIGNLMIIYRVALITLTRSVVLPVYGVCVWLPVSGMCRVPTYLSIPSIHPSSHHPMPYLIPANVPWESVDIRRRASEREKKKKKKKTALGRQPIVQRELDGTVTCLSSSLPYQFLFWDISGVGFPCPHTPKNMSDVVSAVNWSLYNLDLHRSQFPRHIVLSESPTAPVLVR